MKDEICLCGLIEHMCNIVLCCGHVYTHVDSHCPFGRPSWVHTSARAWKYSDVCIACIVHAMPREFNIFIPYTYRSTVKTVLHGPLHTANLMHAYII